MLAAGRVGSRTWDRVGSYVCDLCEDEDGVEVAVRSRERARFPGHGGTFGIEDGWVRVGSCVCDLCEDEDGVEVAVRSRE